jgi:thiamine biosynthesis lipoprotein
VRSVLLPLSVSAALPALGSATFDAAGASMGTSWSVRVIMPPGFDATHVRSLLQRQLDEVVAQMSHWEDGSNLARYNRASASSWHPLPDAFAQVLACALQVARDTGGAYDPCAGALVNLWGFGAHRRYDQQGFQAPDAAGIAALLARGDLARVQFDAPGRRLLQPGGVQLDLSSVAKGFAVDQLARSLDAQGLHHYLVEVGGELRGAGAKDDGQPWWVALEGVPEAVGQHEAVVALHGLAVATSGDYRRYYSYGARRASHTLDPRSGYPIGNDVASVTVIHPQCMVADALSTALSVLGPDAGMAFAEQRQLPARFLLRREGSLYAVHSSAWEAMLR